MAQQLRFDHLTALTTPIGLYEHALRDSPRVEHGMCVDDAARALVVTSRVVDPSPHVTGLAEIYLRFVVASLHDDGTAHNRCNPAGTWADDTSTGDHWGRAVWALGAAAVGLADPDMASLARSAATRAMGARSRWPRAMAYACLGASLLLDADPSDEAALRTMRAARAAMHHSRYDRSWPWPEDSLSYANAVLPEAMLLVGRHLDVADLRDDGRYLLRWLVDQQTVDGHLSVVPAGGRRRGQPPGVGFDQQPIEVASLAEACRTACLETGDPRWETTVGLCLEWFEGRNDSGLVMYDAATGGGFDGLERWSVNANMGAESTLAWLSTCQLILSRPALVAR